METRGDEHKMTRPPGLRISISDEAPYIITGNEHNTPGHSNFGGSPLSTIDSLWTQNNQMMDSHLDYSNVPIHGYNPRVPSLSGQGSETENNIRNIFHGQDRRLVDIEAGLSTERDIRRPRQPQRRNRGFGRPLSRTMSMTSTKIREYARRLTKKLYIQLGSALMVCMIIMAGVFVFFMSTVKQRGADYPICVPCSYLRYHNRTNIERYSRRTGEDTCCATSPEQSAAITELIIDRKLEEAIAHSSQMAAALRINLDDFIMNNTFPSRTIDVNRAQLTFKHPQSESDGDYQILTGWHNVDEDGHNDFNYVRSGMKMNYTNGYIKVGEDGDYEINLHLNFRSPSEEQLLDDDFGGTRYHNQIWRASLNTPLHNSELLVQDEAVVKCPHESAHCHTSSISGFVVALKKGQSIGFSAKYPHLLSRPHSYFSIRKLY